MATQIQDWTYALCKDLTESVTIYEYTPTKQSSFFFFLSFILSSGKTGGLGQISRN